MNAGKRRSWIFITITVIVITLIGFGIWQGLKPKEDRNATLTTAKVERGKIQKVVSTTGKVVPNFEVEIKGKASGKIIKLPFDVSDRVKAGQLLVELDPIDESRQVSQANATYAGTQSRITQSQLNLQVARRTLDTDLAKAQADIAAAKAKQVDAKIKSDRLGQLVKNRYISQEEYETGLTTATQATTDLANAEIRLRELQTQRVALKSSAQDVRIAAADARAQGVALEIAQQRLDETKIYAPIDGVITSRTGQIGQIIASGINNVSGGTAIMTLADLSQIFVLASVDESDIGQVREGQDVSITADAYPGQTFKGKVVRIAPKGLAETNVVTFEVKIEVLGENKKLLMPEMTTNIEILIAQKPQALLIPMEAVVHNNGKDFVRVKSDEKRPHRVPVTLGINNGTQVEVLSGLSENQEIIVGQREMQSKWKKDGQGGGNNNARGQRMMMRGMGGGGGRR